LYWLDDASDGHGETWGFLDRRIAGIMKIPKAQARVSQFVERISKPLAGLGAGRTG